MPCDCKCCSKVREKLRAKRDWHDDESDRLTILMVECGLVAPPIEEPEAEEETPKPAANGRGGGKYLEKLRELLQDGPKTLGELVAGTGGAAPTIRTQLENGPFEKVDPGNRLSPWKLVEALR